MKKLVALVAVAATLAVTASAGAQTPPRGGGHVTPQSAPSYEPPASPTPVASEPATEAPAPVIPAPAPSASTADPLVEKKGGCNLGAVGQPSSLMVAAGVALLSLRAARRRAR